MEISDFVNMLLLVLLVFHAYGTFSAKSSTVYVPAKFLHGCFAVEMLALFLFAAISECVFFVWPEFAFFCVVLVFMCINYHLLEKNTIRKDKTYEMIITHVNKNERIVFGIIRERFSLSFLPKIDYLIPCALFGYENFDEVVEGYELPVKFSEFNTSPVDNRYAVEVEIADEKDV